MKFRVQTKKKPVSHSKKMGKTSVINSDVHDISREHEQIYALVILWPLLWMVVFYLLCKINVFCVLDWFYSKNVDNKQVQTTLSLVGDNLQLSNGNSVNLSQFHENYNAGSGLVLDTNNNVFEINAPVCSSSEKLMWNGTGFSCETDLFEQNTDNQTLSLSGNFLSISGGNTVNLSTLTTGGTQTLTLNGTILSISGGNSVDFTGWDTNAGDDVQNLTDLNDVDTTSTPPSNGQALVWNGTSWVPGSVSGGVSDNIYTADGTLTGDRNVSLGGHNLGFEDYLYIDGVNGNVGINNVNPTQELDVDGNVRIRGAIYDFNNSAGTAGQVLRSTGTGVQWSDMSATSLWDTDYDTGVQVEESADEDFIRLDTAGTQRMQIDNNGNVVLSNTEVADVMDVGSMTGILFRNDKFALRGGETDNDNWDDANIGRGSFAFGRYNTVSGSYSAALGGSNNVDDVYSVALGRYNTVSSSYSVAGGYQNNLSGYASAGFGQTNTAVGRRSMVWGLDNQANDDEATAWGRETIANAAYSTSWGRNTQANGAYATAFGYQNTANGDFATVWGQSNTASGYYSTAFGYRNTASGQNSLAFGSRNTASGTNSVAMGYYSTASGRNAVAMGDTVANSYFMTAVGRFNVEDSNQDPDNWVDTDYLFVIGNGSSWQSSSRSNAFVVLKNGTITAPDFSLAEINAAGNTALVTKEYVDSLVGTSLFDADNDTGIQVEASPDEDYIRMQTAGTQRLVIDNQGHVGVSANFSNLQSMLQVGPGSHEASVLSIAGDSNYYNIATFRDQDGENVFRSRGSLANNDLIVTLGDWDWAYDHKSVGLDIANNSFDVFGGVELRFHETTGGHADYVGFKAPNDVASSVVWTLPTQDGTNGQVLTTDGNGNLSWTNVSGGVSNNIYTADGTINSDRTVNFSDRNLSFSASGASSQFKVEATGTSNNNAALAIWPGNVNISASDTANNIGTNLLVKPTGIDISYSDGGTTNYVYVGDYMVIADNLHNRGIVYDADYSANYTSRTLVDKEYVDNTVANSTVTASNGLTKTGNNITLGGSFSDNIFITNTSVANRYFLVNNRDSNGYGAYFHLNSGNGANRVRMYYTNGTNNLGFDIQSTGFVVYDGVNSRGLQYSDDYSANYVDRSLVDKEYVDNAVANSLTASNGLHRTGNDIRLGGALTEATSIIMDDFGATPLRILNSSGQEYGRLEPFTNYNNPYPAMSNYGNVSDYYVGIQFEVSNDSIAGTIGLNQDSIFAIQTNQNLGLFSDYQMRLRAETELRLEGANDVVLYSDNGIITAQVDKAETEPILQLRNQARWMRQFVVGQNPEGNVTGNVGDIAYDSVSGEMYIKHTGNNTNAGWLRMLRMGDLTSLWDQDGDTGIQVEESADEDYLRFDTAGTQRMQIDNAGNIVISDTEVTDITDLNAMTGMIYRNDKHAFRGGETDDTNWDNNNIGVGSFAFGRNLTVTDDQSAAFGYRNTILQARYAFVAGYNNTVNGESAVAFGQSNQATDVRAMAWGLDNIASQDEATAFGRHTVASADYATSWGRDTHATAEFATVFGYLNDATANLSTAWGFHTVANSYLMTALGQYNVEDSNQDASNWVDTDYLFVIGNGTDVTDRHNAFVVLKNGTITAPEFSLAEINTAGSTALVTKEYVDSMLGSMWDMDQDTGIEVERNADEDVIHFNIGDASGTAHPDAMVIASNGYVGVNNTAPTQPLDVNGNIQTNAALIARGGSNGGEAAHLVVDAGASTLHRIAQFENNNGIQMTITGNNGIGIVGIGLANPQAALHIRGTDGRVLGLDDGNGGFSTIFETQSNPEGNIIGFRGDLAIDGANGDIYIKNANDNADTGWVRLLEEGDWATLWDADHDTGIFAEESTDEDMLRFDTAGVQRMIIKDSGLMGIGTETNNFDVFYFGNVTTTLSVNQANSEMAAVNTIHINDDDQPSRINFTKARGTPGSEAVVQLNDEIGELSSIAFDGTRYVSTGGLSVRVDGTVQTNSVPSRLVFLTTTESDGGASEKVTIDNQGRVGIGTEDPMYKLQVESGAIMIHGGIVPTPTTGYGGIYVNGGELYAMDGSGNSTQLSPHDSNGEWWFNSTNVNTGKSIQIKMESLTKELNKMLGGGYIIENGEEIDKGENVFDKLEDKTLSLEEVINSLKQAVKALNNKVKELQDLVSSLQEKINSIAGKLTGIENKVSKTDEKVESLEQENLMLKTALCEKDDSYPWCEAMCEEEDSSDYSWCSAEQETDNNNNESSTESQEGNASDESSDSSQEDSSTTNNESEQESSSGE